MTPHDAQSKTIAPADGRGESEPFSGGAEILGGEVAQGNRLLVIGGSNGGVDLEALHRAYPDWQIDRCGNYLAGIAELARKPARAVLARLESAPRRVADAIAALREAGGPGTRIVLTCSPTQEPAARSAVGFGADDYLLEPLNVAEIDAAIGYARLATLAERGAAPHLAVSVQEISRIANLLAALGGDPKNLLVTMADLLREALGARGVSLVVEGAVEQSGPPVRSPVLTAALCDADRVIGQLLVGERSSGPYTPGDAQKLEQYAALFSRVLALAARQRGLEKLALTDECSGLPNRRCLRDRLARILRRAADERFQVTVLLFDIDDFKSYNDRFGHAAGDEIIRVVGQLFRRNCREQDIVTRYGGDEFCVVFWDPAGPREAGSRHLEEALVVLDRFQGALRSHQFSSIAAELGQKPGESAGAADRPRITITISGGLATFPWDGADADALLPKADMALLAAKRAGKNRIFVVSESGADPLESTRGQA